MVDAIDWNESSQGYPDFSIHEGHLGGLKVCVMNEDHTAPDIQICINPLHKERQSEVKPVMNRISDVRFEYERTNSDGKSDKIAVSIGIKSSKDDDKKSEPNSESNSGNDTSSSDIDSRDRDYEKN
jgi:hypothetical protein